MSKIEIGRWSEQLRRMLGMAGTVDVAADLSPEISPTIQLEGESIEWNFLKGVRCCGFGDALAGVALNNSRWRFRNPLTSGLVAIIEVFAITPTTLSNLRLAVSEINVDLPTAVFPAVVDGRWGPVATARPALIITGDNSSTDLPLGESIGETTRAADLEWLYDKEIILVPGSTLDVGCATVNVECRIWARWRERGFPELETTV